MKTVGLIFLSILLMAAFGWASSGVSSKTEVSDAREWSVTGLDQLDLQDIKMAAEKAIRSDIFPENVNNNQPSVAIIEQGAEVSKASDFPEIQGVSIIDGTPHVLLWLEDGGPNYFSVSDDIDENWSIRQLDMQEVIAYSRVDEQEYNFFITGSNLLLDSEN